MSIAFICMDPPAQGTKSGPVLFRHLERLKTRQRVVCCHFNEARQVLPCEGLRLPLRRWWFIPARGARLLPLLNQWCRTLWLQRRLKLGKSDTVLVCVHTPEHQLARLLTRLSGARLITLVHDEWKASAEVRKTFQSAYVSLCVSEALAERVKAEGAARVEVLPPLCQGFLGDGLSEAAPQRQVLGLAGSLDATCVRAALRFGLPVFALGTREEFRDLTLPASPQLELHPRLERNEEALKRLRDHCLALLVYQDPESGFYARSSFPSKLLDFVQTGLPVIICAPPGAPVSKWSRQREWLLYVQAPATEEDLCLVRARLQDKSYWHQAAAQSRSTALGEFNPDKIQSALEAWLPGETH